jgi:hypothetical protein
LIDPLRCICSIHTYETYRAEASATDVRESAKAYTLQSGRLRRINEYVCSNIDT